MNEEEKSKELTRSSFAAQMAMLGYEPDGNPKDMVEVVRCKDCKHYRINTVYPGTSMIMTYCAKTGITKSNPDWFCADGERKEGR